MEARLELDNTDYKNTQKLTWLSDVDRAPLTPTVCVHFDHLITKGVLKPDEDFKDFVNWNSKVGYVRGPQDSSLVPRPSHSSFVTCSTSAAEGLVKLVTCSDVPGPI